MLNFCESFLSNVEGFWYAGLVLQLLHKWLVSSYTLHLFFSLSFQRVMYLFILSIIVLASRHDLTVAQAGLELPMWTQCSECAIACSFVPPRIFSKIHWFYLLLVLSFSLPCPLSCLCVWVCAFQDVPVKDWGLYVWAVLWGAAPAACSGLVSSVWKLLLGLLLDREKAQCQKLSWLLWRLCPWLLLLQCFMYVEAPGLLKKCHSFLRDTINMI